MKNWALTGSLLFLLFTQLSFSQLTTAAEGPSPSSTSSSNRNPFVMENVYDKYILDQVKKWCGPLDDKSKDLEKDPALLKRHEANCDRFRTQMSNPSSTSCKDKYQRAVSNLDKLHDACGDANLAIESCIEQVRDNEMACEVESTRNQRLRSEANQQRKLADFLSNGNEDKSHKGARCVSHSRKEYSDLKTNIDKDLDKLQTDQASLEREIIKRRDEASREVSKLNERKADSEKQFSLSINERKQGEQRRAREMLGEVARLDSQKANVRVQMTPIQMEINQMHSAELKELRQYADIRSICKAELMQSLTRQKQLSQLNSSSSFMTEAVLSIEAQKKEFRLCVENYEAEKVAIRKKYSSLRAGKRAEITGKEDEIRNLDKERAEIGKHRAETQADLSRLNSQLGENFKRQMDQFATDEKRFKDSQAESEKLSTKAQEEIDRKRKEIDFKIAELGARPRGEKGYDGILGKYKRFESAANEVLADRACENDSKNLRVELERLKNSDRKVANAKANPGGSTVGASAADPSSGISRTGIEASSGKGRGDED